MQEIWKPIQYDGYEISNFGRVKSYKYDKVNGKLMKPYLDTKGYLQIDLSLDGRKRNNRVHLAIHRLVAQAFISNPNNLPQVNHKDEDKTNNCADNLEWCTNKYNCNYGNHVENIAKKTRMQIYSIDENGNVEYFDGVRAAVRILSNGKKNSSAQISKVLDKPNMTYLGRHWFRKK